MKRLVFLSLAVLLAVPALVACGVTSGNLPADGSATSEPATPTQTALRPIPASTPTAASPTEPTAKPATTSTRDSIETVPDACPQATANTRLLINSPGGYCLLYPDSHTAVKGGFDGPEPSGVRIVAGSILNTGTPWVTITVSDAGGRTIEQLTEEAQGHVDQLSEYGAELFEIEVAGQPAVLTTGNPGQDFTRVVTFVHEGVRYIFIFGPDDVAGSEISERLTAFADVILNSFAFTPITETVTAADECLMPRNTEKSVFSGTLGFCLYIPSNYVFGETGEESALIRAVSPDAETLPQLMIEVADLETESAAQLTDELIREMNALTGQPVSIALYTIGDGDTLVKMIDGAPGYELERLMIVDHGDRQYRLIFTPYNPAQPELTGAMDAFITQVTQSFRFLP